MQLIDRDISFLEVQIVTIRHARIIAHPLAYFRQALPGDGEKRAKRVAHDMRRDPRKVLLKLPTHEFQVEIEGANEIVAVAALPALDLRSDAPRPIHLVAIQEGDKDICQRYRARFAVLWPKSLCLLHSEGTASNRKPGRTGLDNLVTTQSGLKSGVHDKANHAALVFRHDFARHLLPASQQGISKLRLAIFGFRPVIPSSHADASRRIRGDDASFLLKPREKRAQTHHVALSGGLGYAAAFLPVESLQIRCLDRRDWRSRSDPAGKPPQGESFILSRKPAEFVPGKLKRDKRFDFSLQRAADCEIGTVCQFECHAYRVTFLPSFESNRLANPSSHSGEVPPAPFLIEPLYRYHVFMGSKSGSKTSNEHGAI